MIKHLKPTNSEQTNQPGSLDLKQPSKHHISPLDGIIAELRHEYSRNGIGSLWWNDCAESLHILGVTSEQRKPVHFCMTERGLHLSFGGLVIRFPRSRKEQPNTVSSRWHSPFGTVSPIAAFKHPFLPLMPYPDVLPLLFRKPFGWGHMRVSQRVTIARARVTLMKVASIEQLLSTKHPTALSIHSQTGKHVNNPYRSYQHDGSSTCAEKRLSRKEDWYRFYGTNKVDQLIHFFSYDRDQGWTFTHRESLWFSSAMLKSEPFLKPAFGERRKVSGAFST